MSQTNENVSGGVEQTGTTSSNTPANEHHETLQVKSVPLVFAALMVAMIIG